ncbi:MAG: caspase family protein, partial [Saprospiraceae bacterium]|nr:caspase family protein [Saprospiraceae bacterium]
MGTHKTIFALLVAIDNYPISRHRLQGCINDRNALRNYLEKRFSGHEETTLKIKVLSDAEATREGIIRAFRHFDQAKDGDLCIFYFSGHGSRAPAPPEFWHLDPDRMNESLVCYDSRLRRGKDLMDKEISYLIWKATHDRPNIHFLSLFDCCHSGTITKEISVTPRMAEPSHVPTQLRDYTGFETYKKTQIDGQEAVSPPSGRYVQLAACGERETAKELIIGREKRGIFTYSL